MNEKYLQIIRVCEEMSEIAADAQISEQTLHTKQLVEAAHTPTVALVGLGPTGHALLDAATTIIETDVPDILNQAFASGPACLTLNHGDEVTLYRIGAEASVSIVDAGSRSTDICAVDELECAFPCDTLKNYRMILCSDVEGHEAWMRLYENIDAIVLRINATAAMNQSERGWLDNELIPLFGDKQIAVWIDLLDQLNTEEDQADVKDNVNKVLSKHNMDVPVFTTAKEAGNWAAAELAAVDVADFHIRKALKIGLCAVNNRIEEIRQLGTIDEKTITKAIQQLESQRKRLELAGEIAADATVSNIYSQLKINAKAGVRDFNAQAVSSICSKIDEAVPDELETLEPKIQTYLRKVWEHYQQELNGKLNEESQKSYSMLMERMEKDAGTMLAELEEDTLLAIQAAMGEAMSSQFGTWIRLDWEYQGSNSLTKLKTETRNLMLLSIPLAFTSPVLSIALLFGARYYKKNQAEKRGENFRSALKTQVRASCDDVVEDICREIERSFDCVENRIASSVLDAYKGLTDVLIAQLQALCNQQRELMTHIDKLQQMQTVTIPSLMCSL